MQEEDYVKQPHGFEDSRYPNHVFKLKKSLYGLKQAPRAWYDRLKNYLKENDFIIDKIDPTLFLLKNKNDRLIIQIFMDDIIFGATNEKMCQDFAKNMYDSFEMSMIRELKYFLGLQIIQSKKGMFIHQEKYMREMLKKYRLDSSNAKDTPMAFTCHLDKDEGGKKVDNKQY